MSHLSIDNKTPFAGDLLLLTDGEARPIVAPVVKATYAIDPVKKLLTLNEPQLPLNAAGERHYDDADESSYRYEPEVAPCKPVTDVVLVGSARAARMTRSLPVTLRVGALEKSVVVFGDRTFVRRLTGIGISDPTPFETVPLDYEHAFGGWDRTGDDPKRYTFEQRNPVGRGFRAKRSAFAEGIALPNVEHPTKLVGSWGDTPPPAGFGFVSANWVPRAGFAGTYDERWSTERMPLMPVDFDRRFFNAATFDLQCAAMRGGEAVHVSNVTPRGDLTFNMPRVPPPTCRFVIVGRNDVEHATRLDTIVIDTDRLILSMLWRIPEPVRAEPHRVRSLVLAVDGAPIIVT